MSDLECLAASPGCLAEWPAPSPPPLCIGGPMILWRLAHGVRGWECTGQSIVVVVDGGRSNADYSIADPGKRSSFSFPKIWEIVLKILNHYDFFFYFCLCVSLWLCTKYPTSIVCSSVPIPDFLVGQGKSVHMLFMYLCSIRESVRGLHHITPAEVSTMQWLGSLQN